MKYDLSRFLKAQESDYETALAEIRSGRKRSHWIWYIFPQLKGLGFSNLSYHYGIDGIDEAKAYMKDPVLSARLIEISRALLAVARPVLQKPLVARPVLDKGDGRLHISGRRTEFLKIFLDLPEFYQFVLHGICQNAARIYQNGLCPYIRAAQIQQGIPYKTFRFCSE